MDATISHNDAQPTAYTSVSTGNKALRLCHDLEKRKVLCDTFYSKIQIFVFLHLLNRVETVIEQEFGNDCWLQWSCQPNVLSFVLEKCSLLKSAGFSS